MQNKVRLNILGVILIVVFLIIDVAVFSGELQSTDVALFNSINSQYSSPWLDYVMVFLSTYGREALWAVVILALWFLGGEEGRKSASMLAFTFLLLIVVGDCLKTLQFRARPSVNMSNVRLLVSVGADSSFPSGHALTVSGGAVVSWLMMQRKYALPLAVESAFVAYSRIYVGVHFPSDVMSGSILGIAVACLVFGQSDRLASLYDRLLSAWRRRAQPEKQGFLTKVEKDRAPCSTTPLL